GGFWRAWPRRIACRCSWKAATPSSGRPPAGYRRSGPCSGRRLSLPAAPRTRRRSREYDDVAEQEDPEAVAHDYPFVSRTRPSCPGALDGFHASMGAMAEPVGILTDAADCFDAGGQPDVGHGSAPSCERRSSLALRAARRARSTRATSSADTSNSWT